MNGSYQEIEIKLQLTESIYNQLKKTYAGANQGVNQKNFFLDTPENYLLKNKWVLRIRIEDEKMGYMTVKGPGKIKNALYQRPEYESFIPLDKALLLINGFDLSSIKLLPSIELIKRFGDHYVLPFLSFFNVRISFPWKEWEFELDKTTIDEKIFYELEVETEPDKKDELEQKIRNLFRIHYWKYIPSPMSKFKRALTIKMSEMTDKNVRT